MKKACPSPASVLNGACGLGASRDDVGLAPRSHLAVCATSGQTLVEPRHGRPRRRRHHFTRQLWTLSSQGPPNIPQHVTSGRDPKWAVFGGLPDRQIRFFPITWSPEGRIRGWRGCNIHFGARCWRPFCAPKAPQKATKSTQNHCFSHPKRLGTPSNLLAWLRLGQLDSLT